MRLGEAKVHLAVASLTRVGSEGCQVIIMTGIAGDRFAGFRSCVFFQRETKGLVWKGIFTEVGQRCGRPTVFFVTVATDKVGGFLYNGAVKLGNIAHLIGNICVATQTAVRH